jgi:hypothetical protein
MPERDDVEPRWTHLTPADVLSYQAAAAYYRRAAERGELQEVRQVSTGGRIGDVPVAGDVPGGDWYELRGRRGDGTEWQDALVLSPTEAHEFRTRIYCERPARKASVAFAASHVRAPRRTACSSGRPAARRVATATRGSPDDESDQADGESASPPELRLWRHPVYRPCNTAMLRVLVGRRDL